MPSSRPNRTSQSGKPVWPSWTTRSSLPHKQEQIFGPSSHNNFNDWCEPSQSGRKLTLPTWSLATTTASWTTSITKTAQHTYKTFWKWYSRIFTSITFVGAPSAAMSSRHHIGSTRLHRRNRANTFVPDAAPSTAHGRELLSTTPTNGFVQQPNA